MKFYRCFYLEPTNEICHGADKSKVDGETLYSKSDYHKIYISLENGIIVENENGKVSVRCISNSKGSADEIVLFADDRKEYSFEEVLGGTPPKRGRPFKVK